MKDFSWYYSISFLIIGIVMLFYKVKHDRKPKLETELETDKTDNLTNFRIYVISIGLIILGVFSIYSELSK